jgi:hypothetical protein
MIPIDDLDHEMILHKCRFDLAGKKTAEKRRLNNSRMSRQMYAITCHTDIARKNTFSFFLPFLNMYIYIYIYNRRTHHE